MPQNVDMPPDAHGFEENQSNLNERPESLYANRKRQQYAVKCGWGKEGGFIEGLCMTWPIRDGISYLKGMSGNCTKQPYTCYRVSCSYNAAIYYCNFNQDDTVVTVPCADLGDFAEQVVDECAYEDSSLGLPSTNVVLGGYLDWGAYGVLVGYPGGGC